MLISRASHFNFALCLVWKLCSYECSYRHRFRHIAWHSISHCFWSSTSLHLSLFSHQLQQEFYASTSSSIPCRASGGMLLQLISPSSRLLGLMTSSLSFHRGCFTYWCILLCKELLHCIAFSGFMIPFMKLVYLRLMRNLLKSTTSAWSGSLGILCRISFSLQPCFALCF